MKLLKNTLRAHFLFILLLTVFVLTAVSYFSYVPIWDGYQFTKLCYIPAALSYIPDCVSHSALFNNFLFGAVQKIDIGNPILIYLENLMLGIIGLVFFYALLKDIFEDRLSIHERALLTFLFGFHPVFLAQVVQPGLDYALPIYTAILLFFLLRNNYIGVAVLGLMLAFTKEPGLMVYIVCIFWYFCIFVGGGKQKELITKKRKTVWALFIPVVFFIWYAHFYKLQAEGGGTAALLVHQMFSTNASNSFFVAQYKAIAIINFYWIVTATIVGGIGFFIATNIRKSYDLQNLRPIELRVIYIYVCAASVLWFLTRIPFVNNPRYMLPFLPFLVLVFASVYTCFGSKKVRFMFLTTLLLLVYVSAFRTIDPISKIAFDTFDFGNHRILRIGVGDSFIGRDTLIYNFEFTEFSFLPEKAIRTLGLEKSYVMSGGLTWYGYGDFATFDTTTGHRTLMGPKDNPRAIRVNIMDDGNALADKNVRDVYFISMPAHGSEETIKNLSTGFTAVGTTTIADKGYAIDVIHFIRN